MHIRSAARKVQESTVVVATGEATHYHHMRGSCPGQRNAASIHCSNLTSSPHSADSGSPRVVARSPSHARSRQTSQSYGADDEPGTCSYDYCTNVNEFQF